MPELNEFFGTKKGNRHRHAGTSETGSEDVEVADAMVQAAKARLDEAKAILAKYEAQVERWTFKSSG